MSKKKAKKTEPFPDLLSKERSQIHRDNEKMFQEKFAAVIDTADPEHETAKEAFLWMFGVLEDGDIRAFLKDFTPTMKLMMFRLAAQQFATTIRQLQQKEIAKHN